MSTPSWEEIIERAKSLGWQFGTPRRSNLFEWYKIVDGKLYTNSSVLWREEVEKPLWEMK